MSRVPGIKKPDPWDMSRLLRIRADWRHEDAQGKENDAPDGVEPSGALRTSVPSRLLGPVAPVNRGAHGTLLAVQDATLISPAVYIFRLPCCGGSLDKVCQGQRSL
jgi:hypothetical protein